MSEEEAKDEGLLGVFLVNKINTLVYKIQKKYKDIKISVHYRENAVVITYDTEAPAEIKDMFLHMNLSKYIHIEDFQKLREEIAYLSKILHEGVVE